MNTRPLLRSDLPKKRKNKPLDTINIPVVYQDTMRYVVDIHFTKDDMCYLNDAGGVPTKISDLQLILNDSPGIYPGIYVTEINSNSEERERMRQEAISIYEELKFLKKRMKIFINSL